MPALGKSACSVDDSRQILNPFQVNIHLPTEKYTTLRFLQLVMTRQKKHLTVEMLVHQRPVHDYYFEFSPK